MLDLVNIAVLDFLAHPGVEHATRIPDDTAVEQARWELERNRLRRPDKQKAKRGDGGMAQDYRREALNPSR